MTLWVVEILQQVHRATYSRGMASCYVDPALDVCTSLADILCLLWSMSYKDKTCEDTKFPAWNTCWTLVMLFAVPHCTDPEPTLPMHRTYWDGKCRAHHIPNVLWFHTCELLSLSVPLMCFKREDGLHRQSGRNKESVEKHESRHMQGSAGHTGLYVWTLRWAVLADSYFQNCSFSQIKLQHTAVSMHDVIKYTLSSDVLWSFMPFTMVDCL